MPVTPCIETEQHTGELQLKVLCTCSKAAGRKEACRKQVQKSMKTVIEDRKSRSTPAEIKRHKTISKRRS